MQIAPIQAAPAAPHPATHVAAAATDAPAAPATPSRKLPVFSPPPHVSPAPVPTVPAATAPPTQTMAALSAPTPTPTSAPATAESESSGSIARGGWLIQIGAFGKEHEARERLSKAKERAASALAKVRSYTEKTMKGSTEYFRARFAGFDEASAKRACEALKREFECVTMKNN